MKKILFFVLLGIVMLISPSSFASDVFVSYESLSLPKRVYPEPYTKSSEISMRIRGIGAHLSGIVSDTLTDMLWNPSRLPSVSFISFRVPNRIVASLPGPLETRLGILLEGNYSISESKYSDTVPPDHDLYYTDYLRRESRCSSSKKYKGALIGAKQVAPETFIGLRLDYYLEPKESNGDMVYLYAFERLYDSSEDLRNRDDVGEHNSADTTSSYSFSIGLLSSILDSDLEVVLRFREQKEESHFLNWRKGFEHREYTTTYDSIIHVNIDNYESEMLENKYDLVDPETWNLGARLSKDVTDVLTFRSIATFYRVYGDIQSNGENLSYFYGDYYYSYSDPDTFYAYGDTIELYEEGIASLEGEASILGGSLTFGFEFNLSSQLSGGAGIGFSYERDEVELEGSRDETNDTLTSHFTVEEKDIESNAYIYVPIGIEYRPVPEVALRTGLNLYGSYYFLEENIDGKYYMSKSTSGPYYDLSFGAGYNWRHFHFDIYTKDITEVWSWDIELAYIF